MTVEELRLKISKLNKRYPHQKNRTYATGFKKAIIRLQKDSNMSITSFSRLAEISDGSIFSWIKFFGDNNIVTENKTRNNLANNKEKLFQEVLLKDTLINNSIKIITPTGYEVVTQDSLTALRILLGLSANVF